MRSAANDTGREAWVDAVKGAAMIGVLLIHSAPVAWKTSTWLLTGLFKGFTQYSVPVFVLLMGYVAVRTRVEPLGDYYRRRVTRILPALAVVWLVSLTIAVAGGNASPEASWLLGEFPATGSGNYFVAYFVQLALILPLLRRLLDRDAILMLAVCIGVYLAFMGLTWALGMQDSPGSPLYSYTILRHLFAIGLGMWVAAGRRVWPVVVGSIAYIALYLWVLDTSAISDLFRPYHLLHVGWPLLLLLTSRRWLSNPPRWLQSTGRASYHIFLVQILWFGQIGAALHRRISLEPPEKVAVDMVACLTIGLAFYWADSRARRVLGARARGSDLEGPDFESVDCVADVHRDGESLQC